MTHIAITNNTGYRNRGCAALVTSLIAGLQKNFNCPTLSLHTNDPFYDRWNLPDVKTYISYPTLISNHSASLLVNKGLYKLCHASEFIFPSTLMSLNKNIFRDISAADLILPTGGDVFTSDYKNLRKHLYPFLHTRKQNICMIGHTIGPFTKADELYFKKCISRAKVITCRDLESYEYLNSLNIDIPTYHTADLAFTLEATNIHIAEKHLASHYGLNLDKTNLISISVSQGISRYSGSSENSYLSTMLKTVNVLTSRGYTILLIPHVIERNPNNNDVIACKYILENCEEPSLCRVLSLEYTAQDYKAFIGLSKLLVGARTHAIIAALSQSIPAVCIAYSRKGMGIMADCIGSDMAKQLTIPIAMLNEENIIGAIDCALTNAPIKFLEPTLKQRANQNFEILKAISQELRLD